MRLWFLYDLYNSILCAAKRSLYWVVLLTAVFLAGCETGYQEKNNTFVYVTLDEGSGRRVHSIPEITPSSFVILNKHGYAKDKNNAYYEWAKISGADANTFVAISEVYAKDSRFVYCRDKVVEGADPSTTSLLNENAHILRDKNDIYMQGIQIKACDPSSFTLLEHYWQRDSKCVYKNGKKLANVNLNQFQVLNDYYSKDNDRVFYYNELIEGADPITFKIWQGKCIVCASDKDKCYRRNEIIDCNKIK